MPLYKQQQGCHNKPTLIFLHGFLGNSNDWNETIDLLKDDFHCVAIDLPGHGASVSTDSSLKNGFKHCHGLIRNILDELDIQQYILIGYSLGGRIALDYARSQDDKRLQALVLESSQIGLSDIDQKEDRFMSDHSWARRFATQSMEQTLYDWYDQNIFSDLSDRKKEALIHKRVDNYGVPLARMLLSTSLGKQIDALPFLTETNLPIYYCIGGKDKQFRSVAETLSSLGHINVSEFKQSGHNIHHYFPSQFADFIMQNFKK